MSKFAARIAVANQIVDTEMADLFSYLPMAEVVNGEPVVDASRAASAGEVRVVLLAGGVTLGMGWGLQAMHERVSSEPRIFFMAKGKLADVRKFDLFTILTIPNNPSVAYAKRRWEVSDPPKPVGFGRFMCRLVEVEPPDALDLSGALDFSQATNSGLLALLEDI